MSYAPIEKEKVIRACERYLKRRKERIEAKQEELIQAEMNKFFFPAKTREKAIKRLSRSIWDEYQMIAHSGGYWADLVRDLLRLAKAADSTVNVDSTVASILEWEEN